MCLPILVLLLKNVTVIDSLFKTIRKNSSRNIRHLFSIEEIRQLIFDNQHTIQGIQGVYRIDVARKRTIRILTRTINEHVFDVDVLFRLHELESPMKSSMRSRRYNILNTAESRKALDNMPEDIELHIDNSELTRSGFITYKGHKINIHYDKYNPNRAGKYMHYQNGFLIKRYALAFRTKMICFEVFTKDHPQHMRHYKSLTTQSLIEWDGVNCPASNDDIDTFEPSKQTQFQLMDEDENQTTKAG